MRHDWLGRCHLLHRLGGRCQPRSLHGVWKLLLWCGPKLKQFGIWQGASQEEIKGRESAMYVFNFVRGCPMHLSKICSPEAMEGESISQCPGEKVCAICEACFGYPCSPERGCSMCSDNGQFFKPRSNQVTPTGWDGLLHILGICIRISFFMHINQPPYQSLVLCCGHGDMRLRGVRKQQQQQQQQDDQ